MEGEARAPLPTKAAVIVLIVSIVVASLAIGAAIYFRASDEDRLREGLIINCEKNGNPLREAVQTLLREEIKQSHSPLIAELFPQIPKEQLRELTEQTNKKKRELIASITPVDCDAEYK